MPGDVVTAEVYAKYVDPNSANWTPALTTLMGQITSGTAGVVIDGANYSSSTSSFPFAGLLSTAGSTGGPKAYLNWIVFDRNYVMITGGFQRLGTAPKETGNNVAHERMASPNINISQPGYVYIYLSNEETTPVEVYFDDFKVTQTKSPVVAQDDYYPFGLTFNEYLRENSLSNKFKYNKKEFQDDLSFNMYDYGARFYDPSIARFSTLDPKATTYSLWTPYLYAGNDPIRYEDKNGEGPGDAILGFVAAVVDNASGGLFDLREAAASYVSKGGEHDFNTGQDVGDAGSIVVGLDMIAGGDAAAGGGMMVTAGSGGTLGEVGIPIAVAGAGTAIWGTAISASGGASLANQKGRLNAEGTGKNGGTFGAKQDTKSSTQKESFNKAKDQNGVPTSQQPDKVVKVKENGTGKNLREYQYTNSKGEKVSIRRDNAKQYGDAGKGDQGKHHNAGSTGQKLKQHHDY